MPNYKLGKLAPRIDNRTIKLMKILNVPLPSLPESFDVDSTLTCAIADEMFGNDSEGDCVIAERGEHQKRFEGFEQGVDIPISTNDCLKEYWKEQGGGCFYHPDNGLVMLDAMNAWRKKGWKAAGKKYSIYAFASPTLSNLDELKYAVYLLRGVALGIQVPQSAMDQFDAGEPWTVVPDSPIEGGHAIYVEGWDAKYLHVITWGKEQLMGLDFYGAYADEAYAVVQLKEPFVPNSPVDMKALDAILQEITG